MKHERYIRERKSKRGTSLQVSVPFDTAEGRRWKTKTFHSWNYPRPTDAMLDAKAFRDKVLRDISLDRMYRQIPSVEYFYNRKWIYFPKALNTRKKHDIIFRQCFSGIKEKELSAVTATDIQRTLTERANTHTDDGVKRLLAIWRQIYRTALLEGYPVIDLSSAVEVPKSRIVSRSKPVEISRNDFSAFLDALLRYNSSGGTPNRFNKLIWYMLIIMFYCGCRPHEVLALSKSDIDFKTMELSISKGIGSSFTEKCVLIPAKTPQSIRRVPIPDELLPHLQNLVADSRSDFLFLDDSGKFLNIDSIADLISRVSKSSGIRFNSYMLRHLYATDLVRTADARTAKDLLGHSSFSMTIDYARSTKDAREQAVKNRKLN